MDAPPLNVSVQSTTSLDQAISAGETQSTSFRFVDLPAEIRNEIYRYILVYSVQPVRLSGRYWRPSAKTLAITLASRSIYLEAMPVFYSNNAFCIIGTRKEHAWLRGIRPEGRSELRNITLEVTNTLGHCHEQRVYNALSLCSHVHLTLRVKPSRLATAYLVKSLKNMHGFAAVTSDALPKTTDLCPRHKKVGASPLEIKLRRDQMQRVKALMQQLLEPCNDKCRVHKGREGTHTQATIHLSFQETCYLCC